MAKTEKYQVTATCMVAGKVVHEGTTITAASGIYQALKGTARLVRVMQNDKDGEQKTPNQSGDANGAGDANGGADTNASAKKTAAKKAPAKTAPNQPPITSDGNGDDGTNAGADTTAPDLLKNTGDGAGDGENNNTGDSSDGNSNAS